MIDLVRAFALVWIFAPAAFGTTWNSFSHNREGLKQMERKAWYPAHREFTRALEDDPLNFEVQMNLGLNYLASEEFEKAAGSFRGALQLAPKDSAERYQALFNLAVAYGSQGRIDEALAAYQECLGMNPESIEVKTNIELLWRQGKGGGKGGKPEQKEDDGKGDNQKKRENQDFDKKEETPQQPQKNPGELRLEDIKRILDELKNQEQHVRAQEYEKGAKEAPKGKDW